MPKLHARIITDQKSLTPRWLSHGICSISHANFTPDPNRYQTTSRLFRLPRQKSTGQTEGVGTYLASTRAS